MKSLYAVLAVSLVGTVALAGCSSQGSTAVPNGTGASQSGEQTSTADLKSNIQNILETADQLRQALADRNEAQIRSLGQKLNDQWASFEDSLRQKDPIQYTKIEKYLNPLVAGVKASPVDVHTLTSLNDGLIQALHDCLAAVESGKLGSAAANDPKLQAAAKQYHEYVLQQSDLLVQHTGRFVDAVLAGDINRAKSLYAPARVYYERIEPIAEGLGDLDPKIDARENDVPEEEWSGFHKIEKALWGDGSLKGQESHAQQLLSDVKQLHETVKTMTIEPAEVVAGAVELLNEAATSKITGEEERYSHTDLVDLFANVEGSEAAFNAVKPVLQEKDAALAAEIEQRLQEVKNLLNAYRTGDSFLPYDKLKPEDTKKISQAINSVAEPLSQVAKILE
ncbi:MAG: imelysin family protein [Kyrpidia sp.]|nr:imelysin family protein [Kyrpidia sp.]